MSSFDIVYIASSNNFRGSLTILFRFTYTLLGVFQIMNAIREIRKNRKITIRELSKLTGIDESHLSKIERGEANVSEAKLRNIAKALNTSVSALLAEVPIDYMIISPTGGAFILETKQLKEQDNIQNYLSYVKKFRTDYLARLILLGSKGHCELCGAEAPCLDENKRPYLLTHVVDPNNTTLDPVQNMVALCPNCNAKLASNPSEEDLETIRKAASSHTF